MKTESIRLSNQPTKPMTGIITDQIAPHAWVTFPLPSTIPLPIPTEPYDAHDGECYAVSLAYSLKEVAIDHEAWLVGGEVVGRDIMGFVPDELESHTVLFLDENNNHWAVTAEKAKEIAEEVFERLIAGDDEVAAFDIINL
jgi:hypothetical protein